MNNTQITKPKTGLSLMDLAKKLTDIRENQKDYIVPAASMAAEVSDGKTVLSFDVNGQKTVNQFNNWSLGQVATNLEIPKQYLERLQVENPEIAAININHGLDTHKDKKHMLRTVNGNLRGFLSDSYRPLDSYDLLETILPVAEKNSLQLISSEITDKNMFLKFLSPNLKAEIIKGDVVNYGLMVKTSDVGAGALVVAPFVNRLVCMNGMVMNGLSEKVIHRGAKIKDNFAHILSQHTRNVSDAAFWLTIKDMVNYSINEMNWELEINKLRESAGLQITNIQELPKVVELTMKHIGLTGENKKNSILANLLSGNQGAGLTQYGLINSITAAAKEDQFDYETSVEMETAASNVLELSRKDWNRIAESVA